MYAQSATPLMQVVRYHSLVIDAISMPEDLIPTAWTVVSDSNYVSSFKGAPSAGSFLESSAWSCNFLGGNSSTLDGVWMQSHLGEDQGMVMHNEDGSLVWRRQGSLPDLVVGNVFDGSNNQSWLTELPSVPSVKKEGALLMAMSHRHRPHHAVQVWIDSAFNQCLVSSFFALSVANGAVCGYTTTATGLLLAGCMPAVGHVHRK